MAKQNIPIGPIINGVMAILPGIMNTVGSLVKDKKAKKAWEVAGEVATVIPATAIAPDGDSSETVTKAKKKPLSSIISAGVSLSSGRMLNVGVVASLAPVAASDILSNGVNSGNLALLGMVLGYSAAMKFITSWSEKQ